MNLGEIKYFTHSSKTRCVFVDNKDLNLISIDFWIKAGSSVEDLDKNGTAHLLEHMIFKGNNLILPGEFDHKIESLGGLSNASTGYDDVHYHVLIPPNNFKESLALLTNIVLFPCFDIQEFDKEKGVVIDEIKQQNDQPDEKLFNYFLKKVWGNVPYGNPILGSEESLKNISIKDLEKFHRENYLQKSFCVAVAGSLSKNIFKVFEESKLLKISKLTKEKNLNKISLNKNKITAKSRTGREEIIFEKLEFSRIFMAWGIPSLNDQKNIIGLEILASILSVGRNSRLVKFLKEENNLVESVYADLNVGELGGLFIIETCCEIKNTKNVEIQINKLIDELSIYKNLTIDEIRKAINILKSNYIFNLETSSQISSFYGNELLWGRKNSVHKLDIYLDYWNNLTNFKEIIQFLKKEKFTLVASPKK